CVQGYRVRGVLITRSPEAHSSCTFSRWRDLCTFGLDVTVEDRDVRCDEAMTQTDAAPDRSSLVPGVHRLVRAVDRNEGPFSGALIVHEDGVAVSVPVAELAGWDGW